MLAVLTTIGNLLVYQLAILSRALNSSFHEIYMMCAGNIF